MTNFANGVSSLGIPDPVMADGWPIFVGGRRGARTSPSLAGSSKPSAPIEEAVRLSGVAVPRYVHRRLRHLGRARGPLGRHRDGPHRRRRPDRESAWVRNCR